MAGSLCTAVREWTAACGPEQVTVCLTVTRYLNVPVCLSVCVGWLTAGVINPLKPSGHYMYRQFNIQQFYDLPTQCIYVFCVDLRTNSDYFPIQH